MANPATLKPGYHGQGFKPGQSGNPSGRGVLQGLIRKYTEEKNTARLQALVVDMYERAMQGDATARTELLNRGYGKAIQPVEADITTTVTLADALSKILEQNNTDANG